MSSVAYALFGGVVAMLGDLREGYRYTKLALSLVDKFENSNVTGEVICICIHVMTYNEPFLVLNAELNKGLQRALAVGGIFLACLNRTIYCIAMLSFGIKLNTLKDELEKADRFMQEHNLSTPFSRTIRILQHYVSQLMHDERQIGRNNDVIIDEASFQDMHASNIIIM